MENQESYFSTTKGKREVRELFFSYAGRVSSMDPFEKDLLLRYFFKDESLEEIGKRYSLEATWLEKKRDCIIGELLLELH